MKTNIKVKLQMKPTRQILESKGLGPNGDVTKQFTAIVNHRITRYMPYRTGTLATKSKRMIGPNQIEVMGPYARYMYYGKVMVDPKTGAAGFQDKNGEWKSRRGVNKVESGRPINYDTTKGHPLAGPFWDKRMMAAEGAQITKELQTYIDKKAGKR